jgi:TIR domain
MQQPIQFDVFLSHSSLDKAVVRALAIRLKQDGLQVWFDEWEIKIGDPIPTKIEEGLENSRILILCMSSHAFGTDWVELESQTFRFRDPLNRGRRFIPLLLDDEPIKGSVAQFKYLDWRAAGDEAYNDLLAACGKVNSTPTTNTSTVLGEDTGSNLSNLKRSDTKLPAAPEGTATKPQKLVTVSGNGNIIGNHNNLNNSTVVYNENHIHNKYKKPPTSDNASSKNTAEGVFVASMIGVGTVLWLFFKHADKVYNYLECVSLIATLIVLFAWAGLEMWKLRRGPSMLDVTAVLILAVVLFASIKYCETMFNPNLKELAFSTKGGIQLWMSLSPIGHRIATETGFAAMLLILGATICLFASLRVLLMVILGANDFDNKVTNWLYPFRPSRGVVFGVGLLVIANASASGVLFKQASLLFSA